VTYKQTVEIEKLNIIVHSGALVNEMEAELESRWVRGRRRRAPPLHRGALEEKFAKPVLILRPSKCISGLILSAVEQ
jgi:hypothetical protein